MPIPLKAGVSGQALRPLNARNSRFHRPTNNNRSRYRIGCNGARMVYRPKRLEGEEEG
jgi:hypothetical protein